MDGGGSSYQASVILVVTRHCVYDIVRVLPQQKIRKGHVHLAITSARIMNRVGWMIEETIEVGFDRITFLSCYFLEHKKL